MPLRNALMMFCLVGVAATAAAGAQAAQAGSQAGSQTGSQPAAQTPAQTAATSQTGVAAGATRVHGTVTDPDGELIPGATVTLTSGKGAPARTKSGSDGTYSLNVSPGTYNVLVTMQGFSSYSATGVRIAPGAGTTLDAKLQIGEQTVVVNVDADAVQLSVDPENNQSVTVLQGKDLDALSDDPDELQSELQALAGPAAGPNGGQIYVDGFTGGQLPPKSSIREIRINQNPFSAQYDRIGYGRVEVFTKPGTDKLHGNFQINGNPSQFDSGLPPNASAVQPAYHTIFMFGSITGPLSKNASYNLGGSHRDIEQDSYTFATLYAPSATSNTICAPQQAGCVVVPGVNIFTYNPRVRTDINPRLDLAIGSKNVLTTRYQYVQNNETNDGIGNYALPTAGYNTSSLSNILQISDTQTFTSKLINESRFEYEREHTRTTALSNAPSISVSGAFTGGGSAAQNATDHQDHFEVQNYTSYQLPKNFLRLGGRLRSTREIESTNTGTNGSFVYSSITNPCAPVNGVYPTGCSATTPDNSYATGTPRQFSITQDNVPNFQYTLVDLGVYAETDWKPMNNLTVSYGIRYETQNHLGDHHDFAPRVSFAYGLGGGGKSAPKLVLRGGFGIFYDRLPGGDVLNLIRENGTNETIITTSTPSAGCVPFSATYSYATCAAGQSAAQQQTYNRTPNLRTSYQEQFAFGMDHGLGRIGTVSVNYIHTLGVHELASANAGYNFTNPIASTPTYLYFSEGEFHQDQLIVNSRVTISKYVSLSGFYSVGFAAGDSTGNGAFISTPQNIQADYGRTGFDTRSHGLVFGSITLPHYIQISPFITAQSGNPYNITSGNDDNLDTIFNDRPYLVANGITPAAGAVTKSIANCGTFTSAAAQTGASRVPINYCTGPSLFTFNLRMTKTWGFGEMRASTRGQGQGGNRQGGGGFGMPGMGGPPGGGGGRGGGPGGGGPGGGGGSNTGHRYNFGIGLQAQNLFGTDDLATPNGTLTSPYFGQSTQLAGGAYTTTNALRRITLQANFSF